MPKVKEMDIITAGAVKNPREIGKIIRFHRKKANLTQLELANLAGVGKTVIYDLEKGKATVKLETILKVFKSLNISVNLASPIIDALAR